MRHRLATARRTDQGDATGTVSNLDAGICFATTRSASAAGAGSQPTTERWAAATGNRVSKRTRRFRQEFRLRVTLRRARPHRARCRYQDGPERLFNETDNSRKRGKRGTRQVTRGAFRRQRRRVPDRCRSISKCAPERPPVEIARCVPAGSDLRWSPARACGRTRPRKQ